MSFKVNARALHWVFKVPVRKDFLDFCKVLGMQVLRHEEFEEGCKASCNGPYDGKWSKTMVGYGDEDSNFVFELTYNYGKKSYGRGDDLRAICVKSRSAYSQLKETERYKVKEGNNELFVEGPSGYPFAVMDTEGEESAVASVDLNVKDLDTSLAYWHGLLGMEIVEQHEKGSERTASLCFGKGQCYLRLFEVRRDIDHAEAFGRIAFACPREQLLPLEEHLSSHGQCFLNRLTALDTPGKATVEVVILADPDGYEICFVGDEAFRELSKFDPKSSEALDLAVAADGSDEWFAKKAKAKLASKEN